MRQVGQHRRHGTAPPNGGTATARSSSDARTTAVAAQFSFQLQEDVRTATPRVFLVDDSAAFRGVVRMYFEETETGIQVVGEASNGAMALSLVPIAARTAPLVVLMDVRMPPGPNGIEVTRQLIADGVNVEVIVLTAFGEEKGIEQAAEEAGAVACLTKGSVPMPEIVTAVRDVWAAVRH